MFHFEGDKGKNMRRVVAAVVIVIIVAMLLGTVVGALHSLR